MTRFTASHLIETDYCVVGGGISGVCAALAAARNGAKVVLLQDRSVLGGNASSEIRMHIVGADCHGQRPGARESGLLEELRLEDATRNPHRSYNLWDTLLYEKVKLEPNIQLLLDTTCIGCQVEDSAGGPRRITSLTATRQITEDTFTIKAKYFADCTGDGRLGAEAGADYLWGRESREQFGEDFALDVPDEQTLGNSILFTARQYDTPQPFIRPSWVRRFEKHEFKHRPIGKNIDYGFWWSEWGGQLNTIKDWDGIRHELLRIALGVWDYIKNSGEHPDSANWALDWIGSIPGKRESRRFIGEHILVQDDIMGGRVFPDTVAYGGWWLDLHPPSGVDAIEEKPCIQHHIPYLYGIPLASLHSRNVGNLFFAGRNVSATHVAFASTRVMGTCAVMGQAIGTAGALLIAEDADAEISLGYAKQERLERLQQRLLKDDAFLPGLTNEDKGDLARNAQVIADSQELPTANVINGLSRAIHANWGPWAQEAPNQWVSASLPAWIELTLPAAGALKEIHLTWDTGLERELILTPLKWLTEKWGARGPQPETVRNYRVLVDGKVVAEVEDNYLRKRIHALPEGTQGKVIRIEINSTWGVENARLYEVRVY